MPESGRRGPRAVLARRRGSRSPPASPRRGCRSSGCAAGSTPALLKLNDERRAQWPRADHRHFERDRAGLRRARRASIRSRCRTSIPPARRTSSVDGVGINHQYSKSLEFERDFADYVARHITPSIAYFSLLRPLSEIEIARRFAQHPQYFEVFRSCNTAFRQSPAERGRNWCCDCPKCRFVFLALAPFVAKPELIAIFGRDMLDDEAQTDGFAELCGLREHKPFECVGEIAESAAVMTYLGSDPDWRDDTVVRRLHADFPSLRERGPPAFRALLDGTASAPGSERLSGHARCVRLISARRGWRSGGSAAKAGRRSNSCAPVTRTCRCCCSTTPRTRRHRAGSTNIECAFGPRAIARALDHIDVLVKSPGVSLYRREIELARKNGVEVTSLLNLWFAEGVEVTTICVTGTKGKSTTASLIAHILGRLGRRVALAGNIGVPVTEIDPAQGRLRGHRGVELPGRGFRRGLRHRGADLAVSRASRLARHARRLLPRQAQSAAPQPMRDRQPGGDFGTAASARHFFNDDSRVPCARQRNLRRSRPDRRGAQPLSRPAAQSLECLRGADGREGARASTSPRRSTRPAIFARCRIASRRSAKSTACSTSTTAFRPRPESTIAALEVYARAGDHRDRRRLRPRHRLRQAGRAGSRRARPARSSASAPAGSASTPRLRAAAGARPEAAFARGRWTRRSALQSK